MMSAWETTEVVIASGEDASTSPRASRSYWRQSWERLRSNRFAMVSGVVLLLLAVIAITAPLSSRSVTHYDPAQQDLNHVFAAFSGAHWLGTDELGRDTLTRLIWGARVSLGIACVTVLLYILIGGTVGLVAGYYGGLVDEIVMRVVDMLLSIPAIYLLILITSILPLSVGPIRIEHNALSIAFIIAVTSWGGIARLVRGDALSVRHRDFVLATRSIGASDARLILRHVLPNILPVVMVAASLGVAQVILLEAALDFIGVGVQPPTSSWGNMLYNSQTYFFHSAALVVLPGACIALATLAANIFGSAVRDAYDPRLI